MQWSIDSKSYQNVFLITNYKFDSSGFFFCFFFLSFFLGWGRAGDLTRISGWPQTLHSAFFFILSLTWFIGSLKLVMSPARNVDFSSSERAL